jgi:hypothetical protein
LNRVKEAVDCPKLPVVPLRCALTSSVTSAAKEVASLCWASLHLVKKIVRKGS